MKRCTLLAVLAFCCIPIAAWGQRTAPAVEVKLPYSKFVQCFNGGSSNSCFTNFTVPANTRLEITYVSAGCGVAANTPPTELSIQSNNVRLFLPLPTGGAPSGVYAHYWTGGSPVLAFADPGTSVALIAVVSAITNVDCNFGISGYAYVTQ